MNQVYDLIIIGGGPAGLSAAIYAGRANAKVMIIDKDGSGGQISITDQVVNYPGIPSISGADLMNNMVKQAKDFGAEYKLAAVLSIENSEQTKIVKTDQGSYQTLALLLCTGAVPRPAGFEGEEAFKGRGVGYCATCDGQFFTGCDIFVIGGGLAACEEALFLTRYANKVYLIVRKPHLRCPDKVAEEVLQHEKIKVLFETRLISVSGNKTMESAVLMNDAAKEEWHYAPEAGKRFGVFVFTGYQPSNQVFKDLIETDEQGYVLTDDTLMTNIPGIYAAGDIRPKTLRQLVTAVSDGALAATNAEKYIDSKRKELGLPKRHSTEMPQNTTPSKNENPISSVSHSLDNAPKADRLKNQMSSSFSEDIKKQLQPIFDKFIAPVTIYIKRGNDETLYQEMTAFARGFSELSEKVMVVDSDSETASINISSISDDAEAPCLELYNANGEYVGIRYIAVPNGHEFTSFVLALYNVAGPGQPLEELQKEEIASIKEPTLIQIGVTLTCTMCPDVVQAAQQLAVRNPEVNIEVIDISRIAGFREAYDVLSVPCMVINKEHVEFGKKNLNQIIGLIKQYQY